MRRILALSMALAVMASPAFAGSWKFAMTNKSKSIITSFKTQEEGKWSSNWLSEPVSPGDEYEMDFGTSEGDCVVRTKVTFKDGSYFDYDVDYCKVEHLVVKENVILLK